MKYLYVVLCLALLNACKQKTNEEFEGVIKYAISIDVQNPELDPEGMRLTYGDTAVCYYRNGNFHSVYNGYQLRDAFYISAENREYTVIASIDSLIYNDCSKPLAPLKKVEGPVVDARIGEFPTKRIRIETDDFRRTYWYNEQFYLNPEHFKNFNTSHISRYYALAKAPYLKCRYEENGFTVTYTMVSIERKKLDDSNFALPEMPRKEWVR